MAQKQTRTVKPYEQKEKRALVGLSSVDPRLYCHPSRKMVIYRKREMVQREMLLIIIL